MGLIPGVESVTEFDDLTDRIQRVKRTFIDVEREVYRWLKIHDGEYRAHKKRKCEEEQQAQAQQAPVEPEQQGEISGIGPLEQEVVPLEQEAVPLEQEHEHAQGQGDSEEEHHVIQEWYNEVGNVLWCQDHLDDGTDGVEYVDLLTHEVLDLTQHAEPEVFWYW